MLLLLLTSFIIISVFYYYQRLYCCRVFMRCSSSLAVFASLPCLICFARPLLLTVGCLQPPVAIKKRRRREGREPETFLVYIFPWPFSQLCCLLSRPCLFRDALKGSSSQLGLCNKLRDHSVNVFIIVARLYNTCLVWQLGQAVFLRLCLVLSALLNLCC